MPPPIRLLHPHPALLLTEQDRRYLVTTDLHIGFEGMFAASGINIESNTNQMTQELTELIHNHRPDRLIILGDVKHSIENITTQEWREVPKFFETILKHVPITVTPGNHDGALTPLLPRPVKQASKYGLLVGETGLLHGHTQPSKRLAKAKRIIIGHLHPTYSRRGSPLSGAQVWLLAKAKKKQIFPTASEAEQIEIYVTPSFNRELSHAGFTAHRGRIISPIIRRTLPTIQEAAILTLKGDIIGNAEAIPHVI
ncbi:MAG: metallophosphoesterase [Thaumarchaeota archaeon]|nr:metallophosphoesterase [Nitrososphaerota archaeon]